MPDEPAGQLYSADDAPVTPPDPNPSRERDPETGRFVKPDPLSDTLRRQARAAGLTRDQLEEMDADEVREHIDEHKWNRRSEQIFRFQEQGRQQAQGPTRAAEPAGPDWGQSEDGTPLAESDWPPHMAKLIREVAELVSWRKQVEPHLGDLPQLKQYVQGEARAKNESFGKRMERFYAKHPEVYGKGDLAHLDKNEEDFRNSPEYFARMATFAAWKKAGGDIDALEDTLQREHDARFGGRRQRPAEGDTDAEVERWEEGASMRPTQRGLLESPPGKEKAVQGVREKLPQLNGRAKADRGAYLNPRS